MLTRLPSSESDAHEALSKDRLSSSESDAHEALSMDRLASSLSDAHEALSKDRLTRPRVTHTRRCLRIEYIRLQYTEIFQSNTGDV